MKHAATTILVVDDTPINIELLESMLLPVGYNVETANSGAEALRKVDSISPDLIILDVMMPAMDGYAVCRRIKENCEFPYIPIIFITAS